MSEQELILTSAAFFTSIVSGVMGLGGGIMLLTVMLSFFPPAVLVPLHGVVQLASNFSRTIMHFKHNVFSILIPLAVGSVLGAGIGSQFVVELPIEYFKYIIGSFVLITTWIPISKVIPVLKANRPKKFFFLGTGVTALSLFIGSVGPILSPFFLNENLNRKQIVATKAFSQMVTHILKVGTYMFIGFNLSDHTRILSMMIPAVIIGTYIGKLLLGKINDKYFLIIFKSILTILSLKYLLA